MKSFLAEIVTLSFVFLFVEMKIRYSTYPEVISKSTAFSPRVTRKSCLLKPDSGPCRANIQMYFFNPEERNCSTFNWGGCQGNGNRFDTRTECYDTCVSKPNARSNRPRYCELSFDYGFCFGAVTRYYYDHLWKVCKETIYSGCGGNKNNFYSLEQCDSVCRYGRGKIISKIKQQGGMKKVLIVNPPNTTPVRGREQIPANRTTAAG